MKIRTKIQINGLIVVVTVLTISIVGIYFFAALNIKSATNDHLQVMANSRAEQVKIYLDGISGRVYDFSIDENLSKCLSNITGISNGSCTVKNISDDLHNNKLIAAIEFNEIFIFGEENIILASSNENSIGQDISNEISFIKGTQQTYISEVFFSDKGNNETAFRIAAPIKYSGEKIGYIVAEVDMSKLQNILHNEEGLNDTGDIYLVNQKGIIQTTTKYNENSALRQTINNPNIKECIKDMNRYLNDQGEVEKHFENVNEYDNWNGGKTIGTHAYIEDQKLCLLNEIQSNEIYSAITPVLYYMIIMGLAIILVFLLIANKLSKKITDPLNKLRQEVDHVADGYYKHKFRKAEFEEYDKLSKSIDRLVEAIYKFRKKEKERKEKELEE